MPETKSCTRRRNEERRKLNTDKTLEALNMLLVRNQQGDKIEVVMGTGGKVHVKTFRRGF